MTRMYFVLDYSMKAKIVQSKDRILGIPNRQSQ